MDKRTKKLPSKDWVLGESRITVEVVTDKGKVLKWYLPHMTPEDGLAVTLLMNNLNIPRKAGVNARLTRAMLILAEKLRLLEPSSRTIAPIKGEQK